MISEIQQFASKLAAEKGVEISFRSQQKGGRTALIIGIEDADVTEALFKSQISLYGGEPGWFGRKVVIGTETYTVAGINPKARKNCITIKREKDGKLFVCSIQQVKSGLV